MDKDVKEIAEILFENDVNITNNKMTLEDAERLYPEDVEDIYYKPAKAILKAGYIQLASLNEDMKLIGDEEIFNIWTDKKNNMQTTAGKSRLIAQAQLISCRQTRDKKRKELEARNKELVDVLKSVQKWLMFPEEIKEDGVWNEQFVKANNLVNQALAQEKG